MGYGMNGRASVPGNITVFKAAQGHIGSVGQGIGEFSQPLTTYCRVENAWS